MAACFLKKIIHEKDNCIESDGEIIFTAEINVKM